MILTTIALVAQASPAASATPAADAKVAATAKAWFVSLQHGKVLDAKQLTEKARAELTPALLAKFEDQLGPLGAPASFDEVRMDAQNGQTGYLYDVGFKTGDELKLLIVFDASGKISGLRVLPPQ